MPNRNLMDKALKGTKGSVKDAGLPGHQLVPCIHPKTGVVTWLQINDIQYYVNKGFKRISEEDARVLAQQK